MTHGLCLLLAPVVQSLSPDQGGPCWWGEDIAIERWPEHRARLAGKDIPGRSPGGSIVIAPIAWRARWTCENQTSLWSFGRPGDGWKSRVHVLGWVPQGGPVMLTVGGEATDGLMSALRAHDRRVFDAIDRADDLNDVPRFRFGLRLEISAAGRPGARGARVGIVGHPGPEVTSEPLSVIYQWVNRHGGSAAVDRWEAGW